jgi:ribosomal protein S18
MTYSPADLVVEEGLDGSGVGEAGAPPSSSPRGGGGGIPGFTSATAAALSARPPVTGVPPPGVLRAAAPDFRNAQLLASLLSATGKLPPRRATRLAAKDHRALARSVKLARRLALLAPLGRGTVSCGPEERRVHGPRRAGGGSKQQQQQQAQGTGAVTAPALV